MFRCFGRGGYGSRHYGPVLECAIYNKRTIPMMINWTGNNHHVMMEIGSITMKRFASKENVSGEEKNHMDGKNKWMPSSSLEGKNNLEASPIIPSSTSSSSSSPSFITQVYNLRNKIEALEEKTLAYFPKTSIQLSPFFLNEMMKKPKNYYWAAFVAIASIIVMLYVRYVYYFKQQVEQLFEQETKTQKSAIATLRVMQVYADNFGAFPSLRNVNIDNLMNYEHFINRFAWKRDFLSTIAATSKIPLTKEMSLVIFEKILSSPSGKRILKEECPQNLLNALDILLKDDTDNFQEIGSKILCDFFEGDQVKIDEYLRTFSSKSGVDISNIQNYIEGLRKSKTFKLQLSDHNIQSNDIDVRLGLLPVEIFSSVMYCVNSWKKRANAPAIFLNHIRWWAVLAGAVPAIADMMISILHTQQYSRKVENFYTTQDLQQQPSFWKSLIDFTPTSFNIMYASIRFFETVAFLLLWKRARFTVIPMIFNELLRYNILQIFKTDNSLKFLHENELSIDKNRTYKMSLAESRKNTQIAKSIREIIEEEDDDEIED
ncbi:hypothetical protein FDP41_003749 [Naegleria fowleri]|uniref:Uncharacterized protein n=1 Tax=Naegleria fowleri TaxID=5763 RepID=A0A6A5BPX7_NAEFO|nr:uncharacterized protein FDP41_003749 [Naegleria fowleri]KAF0977096.1 hypothetical protein FDP41_003749 [Naegleria fowleri]